MKTSKAFSTISYNTPDFLANKLDELVTRRVISFYAFVKHYKEDDERKDHIHVYIQPNGQYQTDTLSDFLQEVDPVNLLAPPLGILPCKSSKFDDWYLYGIHDEAYLASKGQVRKYHYDIEDIVSSNGDYLLELVHTIDRSPYKKTQDFVKNVRAGVPLMDMLERGQIPAPQFTQWAQMYAYLTDGRLYRAGRFSHSAYQIDIDGKQYPIDPETGEILTDPPSED